MEAVVEYNYVAQEPDELTLRKGDIIKDIKMMPGGWWQGTLRDKRGMFPDNFVKVIEASGGAVTLKTEPDESPVTKREEITLRNGSSGRKWCKVLFSYDPCNEDELALVPNDVIEFLDEVEEGWWTGRLRGRTGVFPSNFVSPPTSEEPERHIERDTKELCRVLFPYSAANEDELTIEEGDVITLISRDAPDKGWWKGELRGRIGLFPDNFVEIVNGRGDLSQQQQPQQQQGQELWQETNQSHFVQSAKSTNSIKHSQIAGKRSERAHARKSLDTRVPNIVKLDVAVSSLASGDKKLIGSHLSSLKRLVDSNLDEATGINEELDGVEREEDTPLLHLTASRAKAPRRRLPSSHHVRNQTGNAPGMITGSTASSLMEDTAINGTTDTVDQSRDDESEGVHARTRRKAPWIEELILNQMEKKRIIPIDKVDKPEVTAGKKEKIYPPKSSMSSSIGAELNSELCQDNSEIRVKDKEKETINQQKSDLSHFTGPVSPTAPSSTPAYVPYRLYSQLLDRVTTLEERQTVLQRTVAQLSERIGPLLANSLSHHQ